MDEILDIFDALGSLNDVSGLADHGAALMTAIEGMDYISIDVDALAGLDDLASFGTDDAADFFSFTDPSDYAISVHADDSLMSANWVSFDDFADTAADATNLGDIPAFIAGEVADYPHHLLDGLNGIDYYPDPIPGYPSHMGVWNLEGDFGIKLFDHQDEVAHTLHHEIGHHLVANNPVLLQEIGPLMDSSPFMDRLSIDFDAYEDAKIPDEFLAESFAAFKTQPDLLWEIDSSLHDAWADAWDKMA